MNKCPGNISYPLRPSNLCALDSGTQTSGEYPKKVTGSVSDSGWSHPVIAKLQISHTSVLKSPGYLPYRTSISSGTLTAAHSIIGDSTSG